MKVRNLAFVAIILGTTSATYAQVATPAAQSSGISVVGRGVVRVHADELRFVVSLFPTNLRGAGVTPAPVDIEAAVAAIVKALRDGGVADAAAAVGLSTNGPRTVTGSIRKPTRETIEALLSKGNAAALPFSNVGLQNVGFGLFVDDCSGPEARAQDAALADARLRAERVAHSAGLRLGGIVSVNEASAFAPSGMLSCATRPDTQFNLNQNIAQRSDGDGALDGDVFVSVSATVVFAIARQP